MGSERDGRLTQVNALVPEAELDRYATQLHSLTHGRGTYRQKFHAYQEAPPDVTTKVVEGHKKELELAESHR
jgi:elongation factor G